MTPFAVRVSTSATITRRLPLQDGGFCGAAFFAPIDRQRYIAIGDAAREVRFPSVSPVFPRFGENAAKRLPRLPRDTGEEGGCGEGTLVSALTVPDTAILTDLSVDKN